MSSDSEEGDKSAASASGRGGVRHVVVSEDQDGQRIDNFLLGLLKGVPRSRVYRLLRKGEVRVNGKRAKAEQKLLAEDVVRVPPVRVAERDPSQPALGLVRRIGDTVIYEDDTLLVVNKPSGVAVHGGSGIDHGVIEALRAWRPEQHFLELVHRLDRDTSGLLMVAKKRSMLRHLHEALRGDGVAKHYLALLCGVWRGGARKVEARLNKNTLRSGERVVRVSDDGKASSSIFTPTARYREATLMDVRLETGRTHQIRVHAQHEGLPVVGDEKYGDTECNRALRDLGVKRLFLHAYRLRVPMLDGTCREFTAELPADLQAVLPRLTGL
ncbi:MAG: 23S rRNA pseudouridine(955/2504/2580) synthase RluC [Gammaproteobacteria bacterium]|nr:23S rRNA pseudouridine(955/2504/2580) synthase RluC [Gammaproteobacteria bacterium]MCP5136979.1 23S rRNA pseudouridine(955/2504/2580) synthase RluC [Gammaproteobacteria bacterium]